MSAVAGLPRPVGLRRLVAIELRKAVDTRAGLWLLVGIAGLTVAAAAFAALAATDPTTSSVLQVGIQPAGYLLPVVGILALTSEWSQRTALWTFALTPRRGRVLLAKVVAVVGLALAAWVVAVVASTAVGAALVGGSGDHLGRYALQGGALLLANTLMGLGFGALASSSTAAIGSYFVLPVASNAVFGLVGALHGAGGWLDVGRTLTPLSAEVLDATQWAQVAVSLIPWVPLPLAAGVVRTLRREVH